MADDDLRVQELRAIRNEIRKHLKKHCVTGSVISFNDTRFWFACPCSDKDTHRVIYDLMEEHKKKAFKGTTSTTWHLSYFLRVGFRLVAIEGICSSKTYWLSKPDSCPYCFQGDPEC